jgi:hypothetical protein
VSNGDWTLFSLRNNQGSASAVGNTSIESVNETASSSPPCNRCAMPMARARLPWSRPRQAAAPQTAADRGLYPGPGRPTDFYGSGMFLNGNPLWRSDNDGAGSGLDADLLDGSRAVGTRTLRLAGLCPGATGHGYRPAVQCAVKIGWNGSKLQLTVDTTDRATSSPSPIWRIRP